uniref:Uncharacterized protein n=1 Tax=Sipha flava TaxID=143950 RepID=A0A2S2R223_9HEMI
MSKSRGPPDRSGPLCWTRNEATLTASVSNGSSCGDRVVGTGRAGETVAVETRWDFRATGRVQQHTSRRKRSSPKDTIITRIAAEALKLYGQLWPVGTAGRFRSFSGKRFGRRPPPQPSPLPKSRRTFLKHRRPLPGNH